MLQNPQHQAQETLSSCSGLSKKHQKHYCYRIADTGPRGCPNQSDLKVFLGTGIHSGRICRASYQSREEADSLTLLG